MSAEGRLVLLTRRDCHLCHEAAEVLERVLPEYQVGLEVIDVDSRPELNDRHGEEVPVLLIDGRKAFKYRVDESRLRRRLRRWRRAGSRRLRGGWE